MTDTDTSTAAIVARVAKNREAAKLARAIPNQGEAMGYEFAAMAIADADLLEALLARAEQAEARERALIEGAEINRQALLKHNADHARQVATLVNRVGELEGAKSPSANALIDRLIRIKDRLSSREDRDAINAACAALSKEGGE